MSEINLNNPIDDSGAIDIEAAFLSIAARLHPEMQEEQSLRAIDDERYAANIADKIESNFHNRQKAKVVAIAGLIFTLGLISGSRKQ